MNINLNLSKELFVPKFFPYLQDYSHRWELYMGSAGSSKSFFITQKLIIRALTDDINILVCRRYGSTIRNSCFSLFKQIINQWKINRSDILKINESDMRIKFTNGSQIIFLGLDDENKLLSINDIGTIFVEEAFEITQDVAEQLNLRMRGHNKNQQIIMAWNPISKNHWLYNFTQNPPESCLYLHSTFEDNPFLPESNRNAILELKERNPQKWRVFGRGEWGVNSDALVLKNWEILDFDELELAKKFPRRAGSDLGWIDPSTVIDTLYDKDKQIIYIFNEFYKTGQTLDEIYAAILKMKLNKTKIQMDSAEPRTIDFFKRKGLYVVPCIKGQNSVEARISFLQNHKLVVKPCCVNMINELENFSYIKDKKTGEYTEDTTHEFSHAIDALGYAYSDIYKKSNLRTMDKSILGL